MSEFESWLRVHLEEVAPRSMDSSGLAVNAQRYARRVRRTRLAVVAAAVAAVMVVGGAVASGDIRDRAVTPARPVSHLSCGQNASAPTASVTDRAQPLSGHLREVLVCSDRTARSVWQGYLPPDEAVSSAGPLDYLSFDATQAQACPTMPSGPSYRFLLLDDTGQVTAIDNRSMACNGWPALNRYFIALGDQVAAERAMHLPDPFPKCPSMLHAQLKGPSSAPALLAKGTLFAQATICWHPLADPKAIPAKAVTPVGREVFSAAKLAILNAEVARHGSAKGSVACQHDPALIVVIHAVTTRGRQISLTGLCTNAYLLYVDGAVDDTITFPSSVSTALAQ